MLGPAKTVGSKGLILQQIGSAVQGNGQCRDLGLQSPCLCLSMLSWQGLRGHRGSASQVYHIRTGPELQDKLNSVCETGRSSVSLVRWTVTAQEQDCLWAPCTALAPTSWGPWIPCCPLWASSAPLATATWTGDISQHPFHSTVPSRVANESSPPSSPASPPPLYPAPAWLLSKGRQVLGGSCPCRMTWGTGLKCSRARWDAVVPN